MKKFLFLKTLLTTTPVGGVNSSKPSMKTTAHMTKLFLLLSILLWGGNAAWAAEIEFKAGNRIGAVDNSTAWYGDNSQTIEIGHHQTLTLKFKTYTATDKQMTDADAGAWDDQKTHAINMWDGQSQNFFMRGCGWGWKTHGGEINDPADYDVNTEGIFNGKTYGWGNDYRTMIGEGADVVMTIARFGSELRISQEFTTKAGSKYYHYFVGTFGLANGSVWLQMTTERAHVDITADYALTDSDSKLTGTLLGVLNNTGGFGAGACENFTIAPNGSLTFHFKNYSNKLGATKSWTLELQQGTKYFDIGSDNRLWGNAAWTGDNATVTWNTPGTGAYDWNTYVDDMYGADVVLTITRNDNTVTITALQTSTTNKEFGKTCTFPLSNEERALDITARLLTEGGHLDLLPVTKNITSAGWATYCSPYALNFTNDIENLDDVFIVTGGTSATGVLSKTSVKGGTVPANTGLLLKGTAGDVEIPIVGSSTTSVTGNKLVGKTEEYTLPANDGYVLMASPSLGFYKNSSAFTVGANTAYLPANFDGAGARSFFLLDDDVTAINSAKRQELTANGQYFDLQGRKVANPTKGLYIVNGKKVVIK